MDELKYKPIGVIHSPLTVRDDFPIQGVYAGGGRGRWRFTSITLRL